MNPSYKISFALLLILGSALLGDAKKSDYSTCFNKIRKISTLAFFGTNIEIQMDDVGLIHNS